MDVDSSSGRIASLINSAVSFEKKSINWDRCFFILCAVWFSVWTLLPAFFLGNTYIDISENIVWGSHFQFGYDKNPYFGAWITYFLYHITGGGVWSAYMLSQLFVMIGVFSVWKLAREMMSPGRAFVSAVLLFGLAYYGSNATEFNDDIIEIGLWPASAYFFYMSLKYQRVKYWLMLGLCAGLAFMTKYFGLVLFASMFVVLILTHEGRNSFKRPGIYLSGLVFVALCMPNIIWLYHNDFVAFHYAMGRAELGDEAKKTFMSHIENPFKLISRLAGVLVPAVIAFAVLFFKKDKTIEKPSSSDMLFAGVICFGPLVMTLLFSIITGAVIKHSWMFPCFFMLGLFLTLIWRPVVSNIRLAGLVLFVIVFGTVCAIAYSVDVLNKRPYKRNKCTYEAFPGTAMSADLTEKWRQKFGTKLSYVIGDRTEGCNFSVYSKDRPEAFFCASKHQSSWIDVEDVKAKGAIAVWAVVDDDTARPEDARPPKWLVEFVERNELKMTAPEAVTYPRACNAFYSSVIKRKAPRNVPVFYSFIAPANAK